MALTEARRRILVAPLSGLTEDQLLEKGRVAFEELIIGELRRVLEARIGVASMILSCCALDFLTSLHSGEDSNGERFKAFVREFLHRYDPQQLLLMRHALVHNYGVRRAAGKGYTGFAIGRDRANEHLQGGRIIVDSLVDNIEEAGRRLLEKAQMAPSDDPLRRNVIRRLKTPGIVVMEPDELVTPASRTHRRGFAYGAGIQPWPPLTLDVDR